MKQNIQATSFALALSILTFIFLVVTISSVVFLFGGKINIATPIISFFVAFAGLWYLLQKNKISNSYLWLFGFVVAILGSIGVASITFDNSYDGNTYHKVAVGSLKDGWNPVWQDSADFDSNQKGIDRPQGNSAIWIDHYTKASWIFGANIYNATGSIESGKAITILLMVALFFMALGYLISKISRGWAILISFILALNPVTLMQFLSYYNDGAIGNLIIILVIALTMLVDKNFTLFKKQLPEYLLYIAIGVTIALLINIKFTGLLYAGITAIVYGLYFLVRRDWVVVWKLTIVGITALLVGVLLIGSSSYVKNFYDHGNPLYPLAGEGSVDIIKSNQPESYLYKSGIHKFFEVNLGPTDNILYDQSKITGDTSPKIPFTISNSEIEIIKTGTVDLRQAGYGVWFGGILLLSLIIGAVLLLRYGRKYKKYLPVFLLPIISIAVTVLSFDSSWWARYLPQLYLLPVVVLIALVILKKDAWSKTLLVAILINISILGVFGTGVQVAYTAITHERFNKHITCDDSRPVKLYMQNSFYGAQYNIADRCANVDYIDKAEYEATRTDSEANIYKGILYIK
jgi:hypothetical protein